jgi:hypothetical protein
MDDMICYLNTDLDLTSGMDLAPLVSALEAAGVEPLHCARHEDGQWYAICETARQFSEPESNVAAIIAAVESLPAEAQALWSDCTRRELNIGFDCGTKPWAFNEALSNDIIGKIAFVGASLRITLYPPPPEQG